jgi:hypothetical protein
MLKDHPNAAPGAIASRSDPARMTVRAGRVALYRRSGYARQA